MHQPRRVFYWVHETIRHPFETGIQRVVRRLGQSLAEGGTDIVSVGWDWRTRRMKALRQSRRQAGDKSADFGGKADAGQWLLIPEMTLELTARDIDPVQIGRAYGFRTAAWVHDLIPLKLREFYDDAMLARCHRYYAMFAAADLVFASTHYVANDLREYLSAARLRTPRIEIVPFAAQFAHEPRRAAQTPRRSRGDPLKLLTVTTWEPRKNLPRLVRAVRQAEAALGLPIELTLVGQSGHYAPHDAEMAALLADMPHVIHRGSISDNGLEAVYATCHASVYPSYEEGFGLPIGESLWLGIPCLCHIGSSMAEVAPGGGVLSVDMMDEDVIKLALESLASENDVLARLSAEIAGRPLTSWNDYADTIGRWLRT